MNRRTDRDPLVESSRDLFERASDRLDPIDAQRLRSGRREALARAPRHRPAWLPMLAAGAGLALALAWWLPRAPVATTVDPATTATASEAAPWLSEEDSELYAWLGDAPVAPDDKDGAL